MQRRLIPFLAPCLLTLFVLTGCPKNSDPVKRKPLARMTVRRTAESAYQEALAIHQQQQGSSKPNYESAIKLYEEALSINPSLVNAHFNLGAIYEDMGLFKKAANHFRQIIQADDKNTAAIYRLAQVYMRQTPPRPQQASQLLHQFMRLSPQSKDNPKMLINLAAAQLMSGTYGIALSSARKCLALDAKSIEAYRVIARVYLKQKRYEGVHVVYKLSIGVKKKDAKMNNIRGLAFMGQKDYPKAILSFGLASQLDPQLFAAQMNLGALALRYYDKKRAMQALSRAARLRPHHRGALLAYAIALRANRKFKAAESIYKRRLLRKNKQDAEAIFNLSVLYLNFMNKPRLAKTYLRRYIGIKGSMIANDDIAYKMMKQCEQKIKAAEMMKKMQQQTKQPKKSPKPSK